MKVVVTGGAGFIGSHVVDLLLARGLDVIVLDNLSTGRMENLAESASRIEFVECDLSNVGDWTASLEGVDWVLHLAALADIVPSIQDPRAYFRANVDATFNVLEAARNADVRRFVYAASSSCYGIPAAYPTTEDAAIDPRYPYALTKRLGEELVLHWANLYGLGALSLRFFNVYGPRSRTSGTYGAVFGVFLAQHLAGVPLTIVGDGEQTRDFTYVTDVAGAVVKAASSSISGVPYNVGSGRTVRINEVADLIGGDREYIPKRPGEPDCTFADIGRIQHDLGWQPSIGIEEGVSRILDQIEYWRNAPVWTPSAIEHATQDWFKFLGSET